MEDVLFFFGGGRKRELGRQTGSILFGRESGHSIARPIAFGNRVPPQRTVLRETADTQTRLAAFFNRTAESFSSE